MEIKLLGLGEGEHSFSISEPVSVYGLDSSQFFEDLDSNVFIDVQGINYYITINTNTNARLTCDRCLKNYDHRCSVETKLIYTEDPSLAPDNLQDGLCLLPANTDTADLTDDIRQNIILNLPMKLLCRESCKGLCTNCGANLNEKQCDCKHTAEDPRWEALKKLQF